MSKRTPQIIEQIRALAADGATAPEIARSIGDVAAWTISRWAADELIQLPTRSQALRRAMADPEVRARHAAAMADPEVRARHAEEGEEIAASRIRRLKREMFAGDTA